MAREPEIELLRQQALLLAARVGALETTTRILFALICSYDGSPEMLDKLKNGIFPMMLQRTRDKRYEGTPAELATWLVDQEVALLTKEFEAIGSAIDDIRKNAVRKIN